MKLNKSWRLIFEPTASRQLLKLDATVQKRILNYLETILKSPNLNEEKIIILDDKFEMEFRNKHEFAAIF